MKLLLKKGETSVTLTVFIHDSSSGTGAGLGSLDQNSSITGGYVKRGGTGVALAVDEDVTTEGTYQAPSAAGKVRIGTPANMITGVYELHFHNDLFTTADYVTISLGGASNMAPLLIEVQLTDLDLNTVLTNASIVDNWETQSQADPTGFHVNVKEVAGTTQTANDNGADINAILIDTDNLQTSQGAWATISQADVAEAVWDAATVSYTDAGSFGLLTGDMSSNIDDIFGELTNVGTDVNAILIDTGELQTDNIPTLIAALPTVDEIWAKAMVDLAQGAPSATASVLVAINHLYEAWRNKTTTTATLITQMKDDGTTGLVKSTISDDGTTFSKGEFVSGA